MTKEERQAYLETLPEEEKQKIMDKMKAAMKAKDQVSLAALRAIKSAIQMAKTEASGSELSSDDELAILTKLQKQRKDSIEVYEKDTKAYAKIIAIKDAARSSAKCLECSGKRKNEPILGMNILTGLKKDGNEWSGGKILDPKNGKEYKCYIQLLDDNTLKLKSKLAVKLIEASAFGSKELIKSFSSPPISTPNESTEKPGVSKLADALNKYSGESGAFKLNFLL